MNSRRKEPCDHRIYFTVTHYKGIPIYWCAICEQHFREKPAA